ncbi:Beta-galactosidase trimerisation domain protein [Thermoanaerobacterium thermosaccharolyticum DSM 571]|uniref:Beta-galactosidase trimerisation domain protein n=1 Tax=Thermoanaerobacterium thermosaccharolyticum (strain ATCC 7956 / DSM 571 / NCIMB 9385 / NCA 3814 / NCTC 13789 / WDCM 00135 / 2032) TaxID=580327 RepID=D9TTF6_THETC|nr:beta-galactosidase trimerization domain-containing protein [Thermoanaerobacterium thermosaccharolyticum]ADL69415.1 Beta-galactosidase trimerisation domain protein [Thermoanaerobacterium thermosaccharolyticum DSM 571]
MDTTTNSIFDKFVIGANYWPRNYGVDMWKQWDKDEIKKEFKEAKSLGLDVLRINLLWEDFQPHPDMISEDAIKKFDELIGICHDVDIKIVPTFFVGHMSGENFDIPWRNGKNIYNDPFMLRHEVKLVRFFAERYKDESAILFWDLSNEPDNYVKAESNHDAWLWNYVLSSEIKKHDKNHPVTLGIHQASLLSDNKFYPEDLKEGNDFLCMHAYPIYTDTCIDPVNSIRSTYIAPFASKLTKALGGKDVLFEEFGATTLMMSEEIEGKYYKTVLYSLFANESLGALAWCFGDFTVGNNLPYNTTPFETHFGITSSDGEPKLAGLEIKAFSEFINKLEYKELIPKECDAAIIVPDKYYSALFVGDDYTPERNFRILLNSFILAKQAGIDVEMVKASEKDFSKYKMLILPSAYRKGHLNHDQWMRIMDYVKSGGTLYASYDGISVDGFDELFGIETQYSIVPKGDSVSIYLEERGLKLKYDTLKFNKRLIAKPTTCSVIGYDNEGNPAVVMNKFGKGNAVLVTYPVELYLSYMPDVYKDDKTYEIYKFTEDLSRIKPKIEVESPFIEVKEFEYKGKKLVIFINHEDIDIKIDANISGKIKDLISNKEINLDNFTIKADDVVAFLM